MFLILVSNVAADFFVVTILLLPVAAACFVDCFRVALLVAGDFDDAGDVFEGDLLALLLIDGMCLGVYESNLLGGGSYFFVHEPALSSYERSLLFSQLDLSGERPRQKFGAGST